jgi:hypothetical protein
MRQKVSLAELHDYLDRSGEVFEFGNTASPDSYGWRGQPVPYGVLRVVLWESAPTLPPSR